MLRRPWPVVVAIADERALLCGLQLHLQRRQAMLHGEVGFDGNLRFSRIFLERGGRNAARAQDRLDARQSLRRRISIDMRGGQLASELRGLFRELAEAAILKNTYLVAEIVVQRGQFGDARRNPLAKGRSDA